MDIGLTPVRVAPHGHAEVVWCSRICPARAIVRSIPTPDCRRRCGDLVLHDGEPRGERTLGDRALAVFDELAVLERSDLVTHVFDVTAPSPSDVEALIVAVERAGCVAEDWTASLVVHCRACSEGRPHTRHEDGAEAKAWQTRRRVAVASRADPSAALEVWLEGSGREVRGHTVDA